MLLPESSSTKNERESGDHETLRLRSYSLMNLHWWVALCSIDNLLSLQLFGHSKINPHFLSGEEMRVTAPRGRSTTGVEIGLVWATAIEHSCTRAKPVRIRWIIISPKIKSQRRRTRVSDPHGSYHFNLLIHQLLVVFVTARQFECLREDRFALLYAGDYVRAAEPVGFG